MNEIVNTIIYFHIRGNIEFWQKHKKTDTLKRRHGTENVFLAKECLPLPEAGKSKEQLLL
jgi:hypothetical protein